MDDGGTRAARDGPGGATSGGLGAVCQAVGELLRAQECLIESLRAQGLLDARASGVLAAIDQLLAETDDAARRAATTVHCVPGRAGPGAGATSRG
ncbi:hypothetical protein GCM10020358_29210 [Amorphoplanes nipponensis]|uniref:Uncharacterized protein n=1 Tax=Actinoplanes nipponensis TaxID=135950 RepID=A0A919JEH7_9ACTN|nr:hypothetical protein [Actinoplanes nipponensis]GIE49228.1 hypothetical protein Ani05nite_27620 [Actinoplanes nipponensis]